MTLTIALGDDADLRWAQTTVAAVTAGYSDVSFHQPNATIKAGANMLEVLTDPRTRTEAGAELRRIVTETSHQYARAVQRFGELFVELVRNGNTWGLYLSDSSPIPHTVRDLWATAVSAPSVDWQHAPDGCVVWCEWVEAAPVPSIVE